MNRSKFTVIAIVAILLAFGGIVVWASINSNNKIDFSKYDSSKAIAADENNGNIADHYRGKENASVIVVEYADLQCPACSVMMPQMDNLYEKYGDRVGFIFRSYPINGHQNARSASAAAEAASKQGLFWEMIGTMYDNRTDWISVFDTEKRTNIYTNLFKEVSKGNGDIERFKNDLGSADIQKKIDFDKGLGAKNDKVEATPSIHINGERVEGDDIDKLIESTEIKINAALEKAGEKTGPKEEEK